MTVNDGLSMTEVKKSRKVTKSVVFDALQDAELLRWWESLPAGRQSEAVRAMLRLALSLAPAAHEITHDDLYRLLQETARKLDKLNRRIETGISIQGAGDNGNAPAEPAEAVEALDKLAGLAAL